MCDSIQYKLGWCRPQLWHRAWTSHSNVDCDIICLYIFFNAKKNS